MLNFHNFNLWLRVLQNSKICLKPRMASCKVNEWRQWKGVCNNTWVAECKYFSNRKVTRICTVFETLLRKFRLYSFLTSKFSKQKHVLEKHCCSSYCRKLQWFSVYKGIRHETNFRLISFQLSFEVSLNLHFNIILALNLIYIHLQTSNIKSLANFRS